MIFNHASKCREGTTFCTSVKLYHTPYQVSLDALIYFTLWDVTVGKILLLRLATGGICSYCSQREIDKTLFFFYLIGFRMSFYRHNKVVPLWDLFLRYKQKIWREILFDLLFVKLNFLIKTICSRQYYIHTMRVGTA